MKIVKRIFLLIIALTFLVACADNAAPPPQSTASSAVSDPVASDPVAGDAVAGEQQYNQVCIACHGPGGIGVASLGKAFAGSEFIASQTDAEMLAFVKQGRPSTDPANTTGIDMPPKGGNPALTDAQILDIVAYLRTLK